MGTTRNASDSGYPRLSCGHPLTPEPCAACHYKTPLLDDVWLSVAGVPLDLAGCFAFLLFAGYFDFCPILPWSSGI